MITLLVYLLVFRRSCWVECLVTAKVASALNTRPFPNLETSVPSIMTSAPAAGTTQTAASAPVPLSSSGSRRALAAGAAWSLPVIVLGTAAPVLASTA